MKEPVIFGMVAEFTEPQSLLAAAQAAYESGYRRMDAYTPYSVDGLAEALGMHRTGVPLLTLLGGISGGVVGYGMQFFSATIDYPLNVGGRGLHSWPAFVPITFELTVLGAALSAVVGMLALNRLPEPHHAIFNTPHFTERNASHFYLCIEAVDSHFDSVATRQWLEAQHPEAVWEVLG